MDNIEILTFTGVDAHTDLDRLMDIQHRYPKVEFGVMVGSQTDEFDDHGLFPSRRTMQTFRDRCLNAGTKAAIHLCGKWSVAVVKGMSYYRGIPWHRLMGMSRNFHRVQVNLPSRINTTAVAHKIMDFINEVTDDGFDEGRYAKRVILQHRETFESVPILHGSVEYLFDKSGGNGIAAFDQWPFPSALRRSGYAGGLGMGTIHHAVDFAKKHPDFPMWFDMESGVRRNGRMDLDIVEGICRQVFPEN